MENSRSAVKLDDETTDEHRIKTTNRRNRTYELNEKKKPTDLNTLMEIQVPLEKKKINVENRVANVQNTRGGKNMYSTNYCRPNSLTRSPSGHSTDLWKHTTFRSLTSLAEKI